VKAIGVAAAVAGMGMASAPAYGEWRFELTPYFWGAGMDGTVGAGALPPTGVKMSSSDILENLDAGLMGAFEARQNRWGLLLDAIYLKLEHGATTTRTGTGPAGATASASAELELKQTLYAGALAYRMGEGSPVDVVGGLRYLKVEARARIDGSLFAQTASVERSAQKDWVDPYIGVRVQLPIAGRWTFLGYADIGGFGVGSEFAWQALAGVNYEVSKTIAGKAGLRYLTVDYDKDRFLYDMSYSGLYLGLGIRF
jgi:opacity protein-like surface antigen